MSKVIDIRRDLAPQKVLENAVRKSKDIDTVAVVTLSHNGKIDVQISHCNLGVASLMAKALDADVMNSVADHMYCDEEDNDEEE